MQSLVQLAYNGLLEDSPFVSQALAVQERIWIIVWAGREMPSVNQQCHRFEHCTFVLCNLPSNCEQRAWLKCCWLCLMFIDSILVEQTAMFRRSILILNMISIVSPSLVTQQQSNEVILPCSSVTFNCLFSFTWFWEKWSCCLCSFSCQHLNC